MTQFVAEAKDKVVINPYKDALLLVDVQQTFMPGGGLPVHGGNEILPDVRNLMKLFAPEKRFATRDVHPIGHISLASSFKDLPAGTILTEQNFQKLRSENRKSILADHAKFTEVDLGTYLKQVHQQILWPDHGLEGSQEAELHGDLNENDFSFVLLKGTDPRVDSYSAFRDNIKRRTGLDSVLRGGGVQRLFICGLAYDYCVGFSAIDATEWFESVFVVKDATRSVGIPADSISNIERNFKSHCVGLINSFQLIGGAQ